MYKSVCVCVCAHAQLHVPVCSIVSIHTAYVSGDCGGWVDWVSELPEACTERTNRLWGWCERSREPSTQAMDKCHQHWSLPPFPPASRSFHQPPPKCSAPSLTYPFSFWYPFSSNYRRNKRVRYRKTWSKIERDREAKEKTKTNIIQGFMCVSLQSC